MANFINTPIKDGFKNLLQIGTLADVDPQSGEVQNGLGSPITQLDVSGDISATGDVSGGTITGDGSAVTNLNADNLSSGTIPDARVSSTSVTQHQGDITGTGALDSGSITSGFGDINIGSNTFTGNGFGLVQPFVQVSWNTNYFNLTNNVDNYIPFDAQDFNTATGIFTFVNSGTSDARVQVLQDGLYEVYCRVHMYDLGGNVDIIVRLMTSSTSTGTMTNETLLCDKKFAELNADQLMIGYAITDLSANTYINIAVHPSSNQPYPSNSDNTVTEMIIKKIG